MSFVWFISCLAKANRTPFDFAEGESKLVSGFNSEHAGGEFASIFLAEYANILFMRLLFCVNFWVAIFFLFFLCSGCFISFLFIWVHVTTPQFRYDKLMYLAWKRFLPPSLNYLLFFVGVRYFILFIYLFFFAVVY